MDFEVTVLNLLPLVTGQSARGEWKKQEVIFELPGEFNRKLCVGFWNDKAVDAAGLRPGDRVALSVNVESREYNGRWYTEVRAWRMNRLESGVGVGAGAGAPLRAGSDYPASAFAPADSGSSGSSSYAANSATNSVTNSAANSAEEVDDLPF